MSEELERKQIDYSYGKIAGDYVQDDQGNTIIAPGETITEYVINKAQEAGQLHYLMLAAASTAMLPGSADLPRRLKEFGDVVMGHEIEFIRNRRAGREVKDFEGNVIVKEGDVISDDIIRLSTARGVLQRLVLAVGAPRLSIEHEKVEDEIEERTTAGVKYIPWPE